MKIIFTHLWALNAFFVFFYVSFVSPWRYNNKLYSILLLLFRGLIIIGDKIVLVFGNSINNYHIVFLLQLVKYNYL